MKKYIFLLFLSNCLITSGQLSTPITFEDSKIDSVSTVDSDINTQFSVIDNFEKQYLNRSEKILKVETLNSGSITKGISISINAIKTTSTNRYLHVMVFSPCTEMKIVVSPTQKIYGSEMYNVAFQKQWVEMVYELGVNISIDKISLIPGCEGTFYIDDIFIDNNPTPRSVYIPDSQTEPSDKKQILINDKISIRTASMNMEYIVDGKSELHFTYSTSPLINSLVHLNSDDSWLFFDNMRPSSVNSTLEALLNKVFINGVKASIDKNVRIEIFGEGSVLIPQGKTFKPLTIFTEPEQKGVSNQYGIENYYSTLGEFDKKTSSFILKRGYMVAFSQNADGVGGASRVYIAADKDLVVSHLPIELEEQISRIRVFPWRYVSKKGFCGGNQPNDTELLGGTWFYTWGAVESTTSNQDFVPMRHGNWWPGFNDINVRTGVNHVLGFNEPDHTDQANMTIEQMVRQWPQLLVSGLRVGAPAYANFNSGTETFLRECEHRNLRVDFVPIHAYFGSQEKPWWVNMITNLYNAGRRPLWMTEWNNGANWTGESGTDTEQAKDVAYIQAAFEEAPFLERYSIYNWVENWREVIRNGSLTQAGKVYHDRKSLMAYNPTYEYVQNPVIEKNLHFAIINKRDGLLYQEGSNLKTSGTFSTLNLPEKYLWTFEYSKQEIGGYKLINCATKQALTYSQSRLLNGYLMSDNTQNTQQNICIAAYSTEDKAKNQTKYYYTISFYNGTFQYNYQALDGYAGNVIGSYDITHSDNQQWAIIPQVQFVPIKDVNYEILSNTEGKYLSNINGNIAFEIKPNVSESNWKLKLLQNGKFLILNMQNNLTLTSKESAFEWQQTDSTNNEQQFSIRFAFRENGISIFYIQDSRNRSLQIESDNKLTVSTNPFTLNNQLFRFQMIENNNTNALIPAFKNQINLKCFPNYISDYAIFQYNLDKHLESLTLKVFNLSGILVSQESLPAYIGENRYIWNRKLIPSGTYIYEISSSNELKNRVREKMILKNIN